jgi:DNA topoisomerase-2
METISYKKYDQREHVLMKPGMYIGSIDFIQSKQLIYENDQIIEKQINYNPGLYKIIDELIVNAYDQSIRDKSLNEINTIIDTNSFSIFNSGIGIPIEKHKEYKIYIPELIFGYLLTSSNYDVNDKRITGGTHGIGAKASNIFSKKFIVEVWTNKQYYKQVFENNLTKINKPEISSNKERITGVKITCEPDFEKFSCKDFSEEMQNLIKRRIIDLSALVTDKIKLIINKENIKVGFENYLELYKSDNKWLIGSCIKNLNWYFAVRINDGEIEQNISFVNSIFTSNGGSHVEYILDLLLPKFQKLINNNVNKRFLKDNLSLCLVTSIINPVFNSQSKEQLSMPVDKFGFECNISNKFFDELKESELLKRLKEIYSKQDLKQLTKFESATKKSKIKGIPKLEDANFAGTKKSINCTLILTEGDSAKATAISGISAIKKNKISNDFDGRDIFGVFPLRGKLLNVREASTSQIMNNQEIIELKKIMGLKTGTNYDINNISELRYGSILLMMDADEDGSHIKGLIINFFNYFFPSLLQLDGFLKVLVTPIVKIFLKNEQLSFANLRAYNNWLTKNPGNYKIKYYKGLGTSTADESKEYFKNLDNNTIAIIDKNNENDVLLAFAKDKVNERKQWLINYDANNILQIEPPTMITIHDFIHQELIHFSNYDNLRSIPLLADGLKPSQRKVLYACFKKNLKTEMKVAQLASYVAEVTAYHHGEQSLVGTIINMAQDFIGSNNLNLLMPAGQMGTRLLGGKDHASGRYIFTYLNKMVDLIFKKEDFDLLDYQEDDGEKIEPKFYLPIIPMILVNGSEGIGTGFSTLIPNYDFKDIVNWFIDKLNNKKTKDLIPKFNNFKGSITKYDDTTYVSSGICKIENDKVIITELPIKLWTSVYKEMLEEMMEDGTIKSYTNYSSDIDVHFEIKFNDIDYINKLNETFSFSTKEKDKIALEKSSHVNENPSSNESNDDKGLNNLYKLLKLYKTIKLSNLTLYDQNLKLKTYDSVNEICEDFYKMRLPYYEKRKELIIKNINDEIILLTNQINFINLVKSNNKIFNMEENEINKILIQNKIKKYDDSFNYLINMSFKQLSKENLDKLSKKIKELKETKKIIENKTSKELWLEDLTKLL